MGTEWNKRPLGEEEILRSCAAAKHFICEHGSGSGT